MTNAMEFIKARKIFVEEEAQKYAKIELSIYMEALDKAWENKMEFFKVGKVRMVEETKRLHEVGNEIVKTFGGDEKDKALYEEINDNVNNIIIAELKKLGWRYEPDEESQKIQKLDYLPCCLVPIEETSTK